MKRLLVVLPVLAGLLLLTVHPAFPYLPNYLGSTGSGASTTLKWNSTNLTYNLNVQRGSNVIGARSVADVIAASFGTWAAAPNTQLSFTRAGDSSATAANSLDNVNLICVVCNNSGLDDSETLALTIFAWNGSGVIVDADILFNTGDTFSTDGPNGGANPPVYDLQTIATHEIGHFLGLGHSPVTRAVMFWAAPEILRTLADDDVAGISASYPGGVSVATGVLSGAVRLQSTGNPVFGAHVFADPTGASGFGGNIRRSPIGAVTVPDGSFLIRNVPAGSYTITAEPLDEPANADTVQIDGENQYNRSINTSFGTRQY